MSGPIRAEDVNPEEVEFLWPTVDVGEGRIPKGMISIVAGKADQGKGLFATRVAADVSKLGKKVLYSAAEDSHGHMTRPRLEAADAVLSNIKLWRFVLPAQMAELEHIIIDDEIELLVIDPVASHLGGGITRHSDNIRVVTDPLTRLLESTGCACLMIEHVLKRVPQNGTPLAAIGGSGSGLAAAARAAYVFGLDPQDEDRRILAHAKFNIGERRRGLAFDLDTVEIQLQTRNGDVIDSDVPYLFPMEELEFDGMRLFENKTQHSHKVGRPPDKRAAAAEWLTSFLAEKGPSKAGDIMEDAKQAGMSIKTLRRAADDMAIEKNPPGGGRNCVWDLPDELKDLMGLAPTDPPPAGEDVDEAQWADQAIGVVEEENDGMTVVDDPDTPADEAKIDQLEKELLDAPLLEGDDDPGDKITDHDLDQLLGGGK